MMAYQSKQITLRWYVSKKLECQNFLFQKIMSFLITCKMNIIEIMINVITSEGCHYIICKDQDAGSQGM